jgi:hypothetical protein
MKAQRGCAGQIFEARDSRLYTNSYVVDGKMTKQRKTRTFEIQRRNLDLPHQFPKQKNVIDDEIIVFNALTLLVGESFHAPCLEPWCLAYFPIKARFHRGRASMW